VPTGNTSNTFSRRLVTTHFLILACCVSLLFSAAAPAADTPAAPVLCAPSCILNGKASLETGDYEKAIIMLTSANKEMPFLGDYILFWRAKAFEGRSETAKAIEDLRTVIKNFPDSPIIKSVRLREIELVQQDGEKDIDDLFRKFISDFPSETKAKFAYAAYLKNHGKNDKAKALFKEIFISVTSYSKSAGEELSSSDITAEDLLRKGKNLNNAWLFKEAEKCLRDALRMKDANPHSAEITEVLAYSLFRQKKYREAATLYSDCKSLYWKDKSLLRAGDIDRFEADMNRLYKLNDPRAASLFLAYGSKKRRSGDTEAALSIYNNVLSKFPSSKEDALWHKGWTYYRTRDYKKALDIFSSLRKTYGSARYIYWEGQCLKALGSANEVQAISLIPNDRNNNFYLFLSSFGSAVPIPPFEKAASAGCGNYVLPTRIEVLEGLGFRSEAIAEIVSVSHKNLPEPEIACLSAHLNKMSDFKTSISIAARITYNDNLHEIYYPPAYQDVVAEAALANDIDPLLILSIMREESRFAPEARSVAGALGLMQLMPQTASRLSAHANVTMRHSEDLYDIKTNIYIGSYYLKSLIQTFDSVPLAIAAYNAGEEAVKNWTAAGKYRSTDEFIEDIPYDETRNYVKKVMTSYFEYMRQNGKKNMPAAFKF
jgi:soluble lytic murein transglycosylase